MNSKQLGDAGLLESWNVKSTHYIMSVADYPKIKKHYYTRIFLFRSIKSSCPARKRLRILSQKVSDIK